jgi:hypothetical protein
MDGSAQQEGSLHEMYLAWRPEAIICFVAVDLHMACGLIGKRISFKLGSQLQAQVSDPAI